MSAPSNPLPLQHVTDAIERLNFAVRNDAIDRGEINPLEILQRSKVLGIEVKTLREFVLDYLAADAMGGINNDTRSALSMDFFNRLAGQLEMEAKRLSQPKLKVHSTVNGSDS